MKYKCQSDRDVDGHLQVFYSHSREVAEVWAKGEVKGGFAVRVFETTEVLRNVFEPPPVPREERGELQCPRGHEKLDQVGRCRTCGDWGVARP